MNLQEFFGSISLGKFFAAVQMDVCHQLEGLLSVSTDDPTGHSATGIADSKRSEFVSHSSNSASSDWLEIESVDEKLCMTIISVGEK